jgi:hypothetical protein
MTTTVPTMTDVARHAGVALKTVSRVINNEVHVTPRMRDRVLRSAAALGYHRNELARLVRTGMPTDVPPFRYLAARLAEAEVVLDQDDIYDLQRILEEVRTALEKLAGTYGEEEEE